MHGLHLPDAQKFADVIEIVPIPSQAFNRYAQELSIQVENIPISESVERDTSELAKSSRLSAISYMKSSPIKVS